MVVCYKMYCTCTIHFKRNFKTYILTTKQLVLYSYIHHITAKRKSEAGQRDMFGNIVKSKPTDNTITQQQSSTVGEANMTEEDHEAIFAAHTASSNQARADLRQQALLNDNQPWVEKYRPKDLNELISHNDIINTINKLIDNNRLPHLLFYGPPGMLQHLDSSILFVSIQYSNII